MKAETPGHPQKHVTWRSLSGLGREDWEGRVSPFSSLFSGNCHEIGCWSGFEICQRGAVRWLIGHLRLLSPSLMSQVRPVGATWWKVLITTPMLSLGLHTHAMGMHAPVHIVLVIISLALIRHHDQKRLGKERGYFILHLTAHHSGKLWQELKELRQRLRRNTA